MNNNELEQTILKALDDNKFGSFGTIEAGNKPKVRYMAVFHDGLNIYLATNRKTHKVEELQENPNAFLLLGYEQGGGRDVLEIEARASVTKDDSLRSKVWNKSLEEWFKGPDDPDYVILELTPTRIEYMGKNKEHGVWQPGATAGK
ncbi:MULTISPECIES: pyridoxamine 5'-phosphate oxidase family protein [Paenibacillus]|jgi:general stress protein 26|uniref:General stress protein 26 n=1 Tax=Paenibacillus typhae TaxID=1174501 RepID=A0A1G8KK82_9BACL|nr:MULTISPECIES: pyridoxamine 5'-phosphate oxidase family protein [Paenibacillus]KUP24444.1 general stress protein [Paenibacillus sp. DMB5]MBY0013781.1 pyridoxamine 5'-phosphate oxidase family protein [Paenibacillus typhae]SDI43808.1 General stress protein 26 [Paenibacillus typhae]